MQEKLQAQMNKTAEWWNRFERGQKWRIIGIVFLCVLTLAAIIWFATRPEYTAIYDNLNPVSSDAAQALLADNNIDSQLSDDGTTLFVRVESKNRARQLLETSSITGVEKWTFPDVLANSGMSSTQLLTKESLREKLKSDVESLLLGYKGITAVSAEITIPDDTNFYITQQRRATAAVRVTTTTRLSRSDGEVLARMVAKSVGNLSLEDVIVSDSDFNILFSGSDQVDGVLDRQREMELSLDAFTKTQVRNALAPLFTDVQIITNLNFNWDKVNEQSETHSGPDPDSAGGYITHDVTEKSSVNSGSGDAEPGIGSNNLQTPSYDIDNGSSSTGSSSYRETEAIFNRIIRTEESQVGKVLKDNSSIGVMAYNIREIREDDMRKLGRLDNITWDEYKASYEEQKKLVVDEDIVQLLRVGTGIENIVVTAYEHPLFIDAVESAPIITIGQILMYILCLILVLILAIAYFTRPKQDEIEEIEPELSVEELLVSTQLEEKREADIKEMERLREIEFNQDSEVKQQIEKFVTEKPEAVAQLLRNWLNDEWE